MREIVGACVAAVFVTLGFWHFYMAMRLPAGESGAVPSVDGKPVFVPSKQSTIAVGMILWLFAGLVAATSGAVPSVLPAPVAKWLSLALACGLLARAIGEFRYVGLFKRVRGSRFATIDTFFYSPLCLVLAGAITFVALRSDA